MQRLAPGGEHEEDEMRDMNASQVEDLGATTMDNFKPMSNAQVRGY